MTTTPESLPLGKGRPGPKPRERTVVTLNIGVTPAQRARLGTLADTEASSISMIVRRFVTAGLAAGALLTLPALAETHHTGTTKIAESHNVAGHTLISLGMVDGRMVYRLTSHGDVYLLTPDRPTTYLLQRPADGYSHVFGTMEEAIASIDILEEDEAVSAHATRISGHITR